MSNPPINIVIIGLSISSSWGNGHATTYRGLVWELTRNGHQVLFLEKDVPWYANHRDLPEPDFCQFALFADTDDLKQRFEKEIASADMVIVGSYVPEGQAVLDWVLETAKGVKAFYDIDTPVTLAKLHVCECEYITDEQIPQLDLYLSFTGGPTLRFLEETLGAKSAKPLYCSVDPQQYYPMALEHEWDLGYLGTYSDDRQPTLELLLIDVAEQLPNNRFIVAGPQYPSLIAWPTNVARTEHLPPAEHRHFYNSQRFTLNVTRADMIKAGYSPSVRLFEAAACGVPIISDYWEGIETILEPEKEILIARETGDVLKYLNELTEAERKAIGQNAREKILKAHTAANRAEELVKYYHELTQQTVTA